MGEQGKEGRVFACFQLALGLNMRLVAVVVMLARFVRGNIRKSPTDPIRRTAQRLNAIAMLIDLTVAR